jgi:hypothetical protein
MQDIMRARRRPVKTRKNRGGSEVRTASKKVLKLARQSRYGIALTAIVLLGLFLSLCFFYGPTPINFADNNFYSFNAYWLANGNWSVLNHPDVLGAQYLLIMAIAFFYTIFAPSMLSAAAFGIICFLLTIVVVYKIGTELYSKKAGLLAALFYSFNPLAVIASSYVGNDSPMMLFVTLAVLFLVLAFKNGRDHRLYYALSGFFSVFGLLVSGRDIELMPFMALALFLYLVKERKLEAVKNIAVFAGGALLALLFIAALSEMLGNPPLYVFEINLSLTWNFCSYYQFPFYAYSLFPYHITTSLANGNVEQAIASIFLGPLTFTKSMLSPGGGVQSAGIYGYLAVLAALFLAFKKKFSSMLIPVLWFVAELGWIGFGVYGFTPLKFFCVQGVRFMIIFMPALALLIGFALTCLMETPKKRLFRYCAIAVACVIIIVALHNSYLIIQYVDLSQYKWIYPLLQVDNFIRTLPSNVFIIINEVQLADPTYIGMQHGAYMIYEQTFNCSDVQRAAYVVDSSASGIASSCNLSLVFAQPPIPAYLDDYTLFNQSSMGTYFNETVYRVVNSSK